MFRKHAEALYIQRFLLLPPGKNCFVREIIQRKRFLSFHNGSGNSLYQKKIVFVQLKSLDASESCNISFCKVSNTINSINPLEYSLHCSKAILVRVADVMASTGREKQDWHPDGFCHCSSLEYQKTWSLIFKLSSFYFSFVCFCKYSWERANVPFVSVSFVHLFA